jgi:coproporphyrinogen III oxidase-like Fe-S oxidoreductase
MLFKKRKEIVWTYPLVCNHADKILNAKEYMSFLLQKNQKDKGFHLYIHIPFCNSICPFCPFFKSSYNRFSYDDKKVFYNALIRELIMYSKTNYIRGLPVTSIYFGGGDGACVEMEFAEKIINCIYENFNLNHCKEFSIEGCVSSLLAPNKLNYYKDKRMLLNFFEAKLRLFFLLFCSHEIKTNNNFFLLIFFEISCILCL